MSALQRTLLLWLTVGVAGFVLVPWYSVQDSLLGIGWIRAFTAKDNAPAILQALLHRRTWLLPLGALLAAVAPLLRTSLSRRRRANALIMLGAAGFIYLALQGFAIGPRGLVFEALPAPSSLPQVSGLPANVVTVPPGEIPRME